MAYSAFRSTGKQQGNKFSFSAPPPGIEPGSSAPKASVLTTWPTQLRLKCPVSASFWQDVQEWIDQLSDSGFNFSKNRIILGDLENSKATNQIILFGKVCIYASQRWITNKLILFTKQAQEHWYTQKKYKARFRNIESIFEKEWSSCYMIYGIDFKQNGHT